MKAEHRRLNFALLLSLLGHMLLLGLTFGGEGIGLPGFGLPWQERRIEAPDLRIVLMPPRAAAAGRAPDPGQAPPRPVSAETPAAAALPPARTESPGDPAPAPAPAPAPRPAVIAMAPSDEPARAVPSAPAAPAPVIAAAPGASSPQTEQAMRRDADDATPTLTDPQALAREARREAAQQEAATREAARQEAERLETARLEAERIEYARREAERQETARQAAAQQEAARQEAARQEAARQEAARQETASQEAASQAAARQAAAQREAAQEAAARREAALRAIGRQLDEEAAKRDAAATAAGLPSRPAPASSGGRRARLFGRTDANAELALYAEAWARKIQLNMTFDLVREAAKRPHTDPLVTVAVRSDGSVESVSFVRSSGVADIDEAIRRVVQSQLPYPAFPPALALEYDVIEIRRTWHFDMAIRLY